MTESEVKKIIKLLKRISNQLSTISEDVAYVVSTEKARNHRQDEGGQEIARTVTHRHFGR